MTNNLQNEEKKFIEEVGIVFEQTGLPRMAGRVFGWLLISDPPYQSPAELAEVLMASKGSISTTTRLLLQLGLVERFIIPGERHGRTPSTTHLKTKYSGLNAGTTTRSSSPPRARERVEGRELNGYSHDEVV